jgi:hypothetical protein
LLSCAQAWRSTHCHSEVRPKESVFLFVSPRRHCEPVIRRGNPLLCHTSGEALHCHSEAKPPHSVMALPKAWASVFLSSRHCEVQRTVAIHSFAHPLSNKWRKLPYCRDFGKSPYPPLSFRSEA